MKRLFCYATGVGVLLAAVAQAQTPAPPPPNVIRIFEENVKVGKGAAHEKVEINWTKAFANAKWPGQTLAMKSIAGPPQAWFIEGHDSMASIEKLENDTNKMTTLTAQTDLLSAQDGELLTGVRTMIATYRADLSYIPAGSLPVPKMRYFDVEIFQTRPGHIGEFVESRQITKAAHEKAKMPDPAVYYAVVAGAPVGTFIRVRALQSLADEDRYDVAHSAKNYQDALGANATRLDSLASSSVVNTQHVIFQFDPKMSYMGKDFTSVDPDFWTPKPKPATPAAATAKPKAK